MKKKRFTEPQIAFVLKEAEAGLPVAEVCRKAGISEQTFYRWKQKYGGMLPSEMKKYKQLEEENVRRNGVSANHNGLFYRRSSLHTSVPRQAELDR